MRKTWTDIIGELCFLVRVWGWVGLLAIPDYVEQLRKW